MVVRGGLLFILLGVLSLLTTVPRACVNTVVVVVVVVVVVDVNEDVFLRLRLSKSDRAPPDNTKFDEIAKTNKW